MGSQASDLSRLVGSGGTALQFSKCPRTRGAGRADPQGRVYSAGRVCCSVWSTRRGRSPQAAGREESVSRGFFPGNRGCRLRHCRRPDTRRFLDGSGAVGHGTLPATFPSVTSRRTGWISYLRATLRHDVSVVWEIPVLWVTPSFTGRHVPLSYSGRSQSLMSPRLRSSHNGEALRFSAVDPRLPKFQFSLER